MTDDDMTVSDETRNNLCEVLPSLAGIVQQDAEEVIADVTAYLREHPAAASHIAFTLNDVRVSVHHLTRYQRDCIVPDTRLNRIWAARHKADDPQYTYWRTDLRHLDGLPIKCAWDDNEEDIEK